MARPWRPLVVGDTRVQCHRAQCRQAGADQWAKGGQVGDAPGYREIDAGQWRGRGDLPFTATVAPCVSIASSIG